MSKRVLVVDDDHGIRDVLALVLEDEGYDVRTRCTQVHADGCIGKPFDIDELLRTVEAQSHSHPQAA